MQESPWTVVLGLTAVVVAIKDGKATVLTLGEGVPTLPFGLFDPERHRTLDLALRSWVDEKAGIPLGYAEQLYTFGNRHRDPSALCTKKRLVTVGYLALVGPHSEATAKGSCWQDWYSFLPWEDHRQGRPKTLDNLLLPHLSLWAAQADTPEEKQNREQRIVVAFGGGKIPWDPEKVLQRYELLYEAGLVSESHRDWQAYPEEERFELPISQKQMQDNELATIAKTNGKALDQDHRRILASTMGRLRAKLSYRPVVFELLNPEFTLLQLQNVVEVLSGICLHKQNFRRLVVQGGLVKETDTMAVSSSGRPARFYRFRHSVLLERPAPGIGLPQSRS